MRFGGSSWCLGVGVLLLFLSNQLCKHALRVPLLFIFILNIKNNFNWPVARTLSFRVGSGQPVFVVFFHAVSFYYNHGFASGFNFFLVLFLRLSGVCICISVYERKTMEELQSALKGNGLTLSNLPEKGRCLLTTRDFHPGLSLSLSQFFPITSCWKLMHIKKLWKIKYS